MIRLLSFGGKLVTPLYNVCARGIINNLVEQNQGPRPTIIQSYSYSTFTQDVQNQFVAEFAPAIRPEPGKIDPASVHVFDEDLLVGMWCAVREIVLVPGKFARYEKEVMSVFVSQTNACPYCANIHTMFAYGTGLKDQDRSINNAIKQFSPSLMSNQRLSNICDWVVTANNKSTIQKDVPFNAEETAEVLGVIFFFNYMNRVVDTIVSRDETALPLPPVAQALIKKYDILHDLLIWTHNKFVMSKVLPPNELQGGVTTKFYNYDSSMLPAGFEWCQTNANIASAIVAFSKGIQKIGDKYVPSNVQKVVLRFITQDYTGSSVPLSPTWVRDYVDVEKGEMSEPEKFAAEYMILVAATRSQVDERYEQKLGKYYPSQDQKWSMCMWTAFHTAKAISKWQANVVLSSSNQT